MERFFLLPEFENKLHICDLKLSRVILNDTKLPWIFLIPMRAGVVQINNLSERDQMQFFREINFVSNVMEKIFPCDRLNVAAIGNKTPQLHIHIICRTENDDYWPETVWQYQCEKLSSADYVKRCEELKIALHNTSSQYRL